VTQALAAPLEARRGSELGPRHKVAVRTQRSKRRIRVADRQHLLRIFLPIGGKPQGTPHAQLCRDKGHECRLDQASLVMTLLVPRVRKEHQHLIEGLVGDPIAQHIHGIVADDAQILQIALMRPKQKPPDS